MGRGFQACAAIGRDDSITARINMKPYQAIDSYLEQGRPEAAEFVVDSMLQTKLRKFGRSPMTGKERDTTMGFELAHWAVFYRQCGAYEKSEQCDSMAAGYLGRGHGKRHLEYLEARYDWYLCTISCKEAHRSSYDHEGGAGRSAEFGPDAGKDKGWTFNYDLYEFYLRVRTVG